MIRHRTLLWKLQLDCIQCCQRLLFSRSALVCPMHASLRAVQSFYIAFVALIDFCLSGISIAQLPPWQISISPSNPRSTDVIHVAVDTQQPCRPIFPSDGVSTAVSGQSVRILVSVAFCLVGAPPPPYGFTTDVGPLPPGTYVVQTSFRTSVDGITYSQPQPTGSLSFVVAAAGPIEPIPTLGIGSLFLISALVALMGVFLSRRRRNLPSIRPRLT
jgi:hypothetical protein